MNSDNNKPSNLGDEPPEPILEPEIKAAVSQPSEEISDNHFDDANVMNLNSHENKFEQKHLNKSAKDPKDLVESLKMNFEEEKVKTTNKRNNNLYFLLVLIILITGIILIWQMSIQRQIDQIKTELMVTVIPMDQSDAVVPTSTQEILVLSPDEFDEVNGKIAFEVELKSIKNLSAKVFDDTGFEVGSFSQNNIELINDIAQVSGNIDIMKSPTVSQGYVVFYPSGENINSILNKTISLNFTKGSLTDKINLIGPVNNQLITQGELRIIGEIKNLSGNKFLAKITDQEGNLIKEAEVSAVDLNTTQDFVKFDQIIEIGPLVDDVSEVGKLDIYDISAPDISLITIEIRLNN